MKHNQLDHKLYAALAMIFCLPTLGTLSSSGFRMLRVTILVLGCILGATGSVAASEASDESVALARSQALAELERFANSGGSVFRLVDSSVLGRATLDSPFYYHGSDTTFWDYEFADPADILRYTNWVRLCFPVRLDGVLLGTINLKPIADGYEFVSLYHDTRPVVRLQELSRTANLAPGERVSLLKTDVGGFVVVSDGSKVSRMAPFDAQTRELCGVTGAPDDASLLAPPAFFKDAIVKEITATRKRWIESGRK